MSSYPEPTEITPIFVPQYWIPSEEGGSGISQAQGDARYAQLAGNQTIIGEETFQGGIRTNDIAPNTGTVVDVDGDLNLTTGNTYQVNGIDLIASQTGQTGKYLTTDGTSTSWADIPDELPSQTGNATKYLRTDGTDTLWAEENPIVGTGVPAITTGLDQNTFISTDTNLFYFRRYPTYDIRSNPTFSGTVIPVGSTRTYTTIAAAITAANAGDILELDQETFTIASQIVVNKTLEIRGTQATSIVSGSLSVSVFSVTASGVYIHDITVTNPNTSSNAICISNSSTDFYCDNVIFTTNEFGFTSSAGQFKISNCQFVFTGTPDSHRYIYTTGGSGDLIIQDNTFQAVNLSGTAVTRFVVMTAGTYTDLTKIIITGNSESSGTILSQFFLQDSLVAATNPIQFFFDNNSAALINSGILIFFASNCLNEYEFVAFNDNNFGGNSGGSGTTGIVKLDLPSAGTLGSTVFVQKDNTYTGGITHPNYLTAVTGSDLIAYNFTVLSFPNITLYDSTWHEILQVPPVSNPTFYDSITLQSSTDPLDEFALTIDGNGDMTFSGTGELIVTTNGVDMNGEHLNMTGGEIQNLPLLHGQTNTNLVIEAKGTGHIVFETNTIDRVEIPDTGGVNLLSGSYQVNGVDLVASQTGQSGKYLTTDGTSTSWATVGGGGTPAGSDTEVQFNNSGSFGADADFTYNSSTNQLTVANGSLNMTGGSIITSTTSLLMHFDSSPPTDSGFNNVNPWTTSGTISISSLQSRFGSASALFATNSWFQATSSLANQYEMTIECWIYATATPIGDCSIIEASAGAGFAFGVANNGGNVRLRSWTAGPSQRNWDFPTTWASILNTWVHISWNRSTSIPSNQHYVTLNGVKSTNNDTNQGQAITWTPIRIGRGTIFTGDFVGYVDELRLSLGLCRYTTVPFTPPTSAFGDLTTGGVQISGQILQNGSLFPNSMNVTASSTNASFFPVMTSATSGYQQCFTDADLTYNPSTNTHTVSNLTVNNTLIVDTNTIRVDPTNNRVGIATTTPNVTLEVTGIIRNNNNASQLAYYNTGRYVEFNADSTNNAYIDFHSLDAGTNDYDSRILSLGGLAGTSGRATMVLDCNDLRTTASTTTYNTRVSTPARSFAVQHLVWSGTVNASGGSVTIGLTKAYRGRYLISCANTNGGWNYVEAFVFGYTSDTKTTHQALYINGGSNPNISIGEEVGGSGFLISIVNNTADLAYYHILSWIGGFGS